MTGIAAVWDNPIETIGQCQVLGIGRGDGELLYHNKEDMELFKRTTMNNIVIMGRKTYESLPNKRLEGRQIIVLSKYADRLRVEELDKFYSKDVWIVREDDMYMLLYNVETLFTMGKIPNIIVAGGESIYKRMMMFCDKFLISHFIIPPSIQPDKFLTLNMSIWKSDLLYASDDFYQKLYVNTVNPFKDIRKEIVGEVNNVLKYLLDGELEKIFLNKYPEYPVIKGIQHFKPEYITRAKFRFVVTQDIIWAYQEILKPRLEFHMNSHYFLTKNLDTKEYSTIRRVLQKNMEAIDVSMENTIINWLDEELKK